MDPEVIWSGSDTSSLSSTEEDAKESGTDVMFTCHEAHPFGFLHDRNLSRLLQPSTQTKEYHKDFIVKLFNLTFVAKSVLLSDVEREQVFKLARCSMFQLMREAETSPQDVKCGEKVRHDLQYLMQFCQEFVKNHPLHNNSKIIEKFLHELLLLHSSIGRTAQLPMSYWLKSRRLSNQQHLFHMHLEFSTFELMIAYKLLCRYPVSTKIISYFNEVSTKLVWDLSCLSNLLYCYYVQQSSLNESSECFPCSCVKQVWIVLIHLLDDSAKTVSLQSFWSVVSMMLKGLDTDELQKKHGPRGVKWNVTAEFKLWILSNISSLYWFDVTGKNTFKEKLIVPGNWFAVQEIIQGSLSKDNTDEVMFKSQLHSCITVTKFWSVRLTLFNTFLDFFNKNWNKRDKINPQNITSFAMVEASPMTTMQSCISSLEDNSKSTDNSFRLFLRLVVVTLKKIEDTNAIQSLAQIKGRIYSKFHRRRMEELNADGFDKFNSLFTALIYTLRSEELATKMSTLLSFIQFNEKSVSIKKKIMRSQFIALFLCLHLDLNAEIVIANITTIFDNLVDNLLQKNQNAKSQQEAWELVCCYLDTVEMCYDYEKTKASQAGLISEAYSKLLINTFKLQRKKVFSHINNMLLSTLVMQNNCQNVCTSIMTHVYKPLESVVKKSPSIQAIEIMAGLTLFISDRSLDSKDQAYQLIEEFGFGDYQAALKCSYLSQILSSSDIIALLEKQNAIKQLLKVWIDCILTDLDTSESVIDLSKSVLNLSQFKTRNYSQSCSTFEDVVQILIQFIANLGKDYASLTSVVKMANLKQIIRFYFSDIVKISESVILVKLCKKSVHLLFKICGNLVKHCARALYSKTSACLLPQILDFFVLPLISTKKPLPNIIVQAIKCHLVLFLCGLSALDIKKDEFVVRKMKEIFARYFTVSCVQCHMNQSLKNPFLEPLKHSHAPGLTKSTGDYRNFVLTHVRDCYLHLRQDPKQLSSVLYFVLQILLKVDDEGELSRMAHILLSKVLSCLLVCDAAGSKGEPPHIRKLSLRILKKLFSSSHYDSEMINSLLKKFAEDNLPNYQEILLKSFETTCVLLPPDLIRNFIDSLRLLVEADEKRRGVGGDQKLRNSLQKLTSFAAGEF